MHQSAHPILASHDLAVSIDFYRRLGFVLLCQDSPEQPTFATVARDGIELHLQWAQAQPHTPWVPTDWGIWAYPTDRPVYRFEVSDVDRLYQDFFDNGCIDLQSDQVGRWTVPSGTPWRTREFMLRDPAQNGLLFYSLKVKEPQMKYPLSEDIEAMRARGYDPVLAKAQLLSSRWQEKERVKALIRSAFRAVVLGQGIGLDEAQGIDGYESKQCCAARRCADEKTNWAAITLEQLIACRSSLSFFDAAGMRFHLPAFLIADLDGDGEFGMDFSLTYSSQIQEIFALLNSQQRESVRQFLHYILCEPNYSQSQEKIRSALAGYWAN